VGSGERFTLHVIEAPFGSDVEGAFVCDAGFRTV